MSQTYNKDLPESGVTTFGELYQVIRDKDEALRSMFSDTSFPSEPAEGQPCYRTDRQKWYGYTGDTSLGENGWVEIASENEGLGAELINARGSKPSLDQRLDVALNEDGTLKANVEAYQSEWVKPSLNFTYVDSSSFKVEGDQTDIYVQYRALKFNHSTSSTSYSYVVSSSYSNDSNDETLVTVNDSVIQSDLVSVEHGLINADETRNSLPRNINADKVDNFDASQTPQANQIPVLNSSGQLPLPFAQLPILVNGQDMMNRTFYVDAENGDDNNDGSESAPFKTIQKACDSVPIGGYGRIILQTNYQATSFEQIIVYGKNIQLEGQSRDDTLLDVYSIENDSDETLALFFDFYYGSLFISKIELRINHKIDDANTIDGYHKGFINILQAPLGSVCITTANVYLKLDKDFHFISNAHKSYGGSFVVQKVNWETRVIILDQNGSARLVDFGGSGGGGGAFFVAPQTSIKTSDNTDLEWTDYIQGIVKDGNGVPRNVISNIVL